jgi:hypothetical protein
VQDAIRLAPDHSKPAENYTISTFVVVARPANMSLWEGLADSLRQDRPVTLDAYQVLLLPEQCAWCEEEDLLKRVKASLLPGAVHDSVKPSVMEMLDERLSIIRGGDAHRWEGLQDSLFVCDREGNVPRRSAESLTKHSLFGEGLFEPAAYCAIIGAMQRVRDELGRVEVARHGRVWFWDLTRILSAYHDPVIQASFLRGARSPEFHVPIGRGLRSVLQSSLHRSPSAGLTQWPLVPAEHLLAVAQSKYPRTRAKAVSQLCLSFLAESDCAAARLMNAIVQTSEGPLNI